MFYIQVFGEQTGTTSISLSVLAVELLQPSTTSGHSAYAREERSVAGHVHMRLLDLVRGTRFPHLQSPISRPAERRATCHPGASMAQLLVPSFYEIQSRGMQLTLHSGHGSRDMQLPFKLPDFDGLMLCL